MSSSSISRSFGKNEVVFMEDMQPVMGDVASSSTGQRASILIIGSVGGWWGVNKDEVYQALRGKTVSNIDVFICTPGGDVTDAFAIHDFLKGHSAYVTCYLFGECMSAGTIICNSGDRIVISKQCMFMAHYGSRWGGYGTKSYFKKVVQQLEAYDEIVMNQYVERTGLSEDDLHQLLEDEKYITPNNALELNFVDEVVDTISIDFEIDEDHGSSSSDWWDDWFGYLKKEDIGKPSSSKDPNYYKREARFEYLSSDKVNNIINKSPNQRGSKSISMKVLDNALNYLKEQGISFSFKKDGKDIKEDEVLKLGTGFNKQAVDDVVEMATKQSSEDFKLAIKMHKEEMQTEYSNKLTEATKDLPSKADYTKLVQEIAQIKGGGSNSNKDNNGGDNLGDDKVKTKSSGGQIQLERMLKNGIISQAKFDKYSKKKENK